MLKNLTLKKIISVNSLFVIALILVLGFISYTNIDGISKLLHKSHTYSIPSINYLLQADRDLQQLIVAERTMIYTDSESELFKELVDDYDTNYKQVEQRVKKYEALAYTPEEKTLLESFWKEFNIWSALSKQIVDGRKSNTRSGRSIAIDLSTGQAKTSFEKMRDQLDQLQNVVIEKTKTDKESALMEAQRAEIIIISLIVIAFIFSSLSSFGMLKRISAVLGNVTENLSHASNNISTKTASMKEDTQNFNKILEAQSSGVTETAASIQEISAMVTKNSDSAADSAKSAQETTNLAAKGQESTTKMTNSVESISKISTQFINELQGNTEEINQMLVIISDINEKTKVINDIVFQTKLLSFNASVEAARAGEHGKGFSVVAEEIGNLANMSGEAATEITDLLDSSLGKVKSIVDMNKTIVSSMSEKVLAEVNTGKEVSTNCRTILDEVVSRMSSLNQAIDQIAISSDEQSTGVGEINAAVRQMDSSIGNLSQLSAKSAKDADSLNSTVSDLDRALNSLQKLVGKVKQKPLKKETTKKKKSKEIKFKQSA
jgi:methyl-accepting chemotaxis protein